MTGVQTCALPISEAYALYERAIEKCEATLRIKPDMHEALRNWGAALAGQAMTKTGEEADADALFKKACEKCEASVRIEPDNPEAFNNWAALYCSKVAQRRDRSGIVCCQGQRRSFWLRKTCCPGAGSTTWRAFRRSEGRKMNAGEV